MNEHQKIVFVNKINMNRDQSALQMISHGTGIPSKILSYGWEWIEVLRFTEGIWWRWNLHHEAFPNTYHRNAAVTDPLLETLFSSFISLWFLHLWTAGMSVLYSQLPRTTTSRDVLGKQQGEWQGAHSNVTNVPVAFRRKVTLQEMEVHLTFTQWPSHPTVPFTATFFSGQECKFIQWWSLQQMLEHQRGFVWGTDLSLFHPWTNLKTNTQSHAQIWYLSLNC